MEVGRGSKRSEKKVGESGEERVFVCRDVQPGELRRRRTKRCRQVEQEARGDR